MIEASRRRGFGRYDIHMALLITRREVRDSFRDWRIIIPIVILTLVFPALATFNARVLFRFTEQYGAAIVSDRIVPPKNAPNILLIITDDAGFGVPSTFGGVIPTPTMDRVAASGLRYNNIHSTALCSPTRAALQEIFSSSPE